MKTTKRNIMKVYYNGHIKTIVAFMALIAMTGCSDDSFHRDTQPADVSLPITLQAEYPTLTRASDTGFEHGDQMGVFVLDYVGDTPQNFGDDGIRASNVRFDFNETDNSWKGVADLYWKDKATPADIIGYYPFEAQADNSGEIPISVAHRQDTGKSDSSLGGYEASDFLWAKGEKVFPQTSSVNLTFRHVLSGIKISIQEGEGFANDEWNNLRKTALLPEIIPDGAINLLNGAVTTGKSNPISIIPLEYNGEFRAIVIPQSIEAGQTVVALNVGTESYNLVKNESLSYMPGKMHTFTITVNKNPDASLAFSLTSETITPWIDDVEFRDGIMRQYTVIDVPECGKLREIVESKGLTPSRIYNVKLTGNLNEEDFRFIKETMINLVAVNLYGATTYKGGEPYHIPGAALQSLNINHIIFPKKLKSIGVEALRATTLVGDLIIPEGVETLEWGCFMDCSVSGTLTLPSSLKRIDGSAFQYTKLSGSLHLPEGLTYLGGGAFDGTRFSGELVLPDNLREIGGGAFNNNNFSGSLAIPQGWKEIPESLFSGCNFTGTLTIPEGVERIGKNAFVGCGFKGELLLPSSLYRIGENAFANTKFSNIVFPENLDYIDEGAFSDCSRLGGMLRLPEKLKVIMARTFENCSLLDEIILPSEIVKIEGHAFKDCYNLSSIVCNSEEPPLFVPFKLWSGESANPFDGVPKDNFTLQVPEKSVDAYRRAEGWRDFKRIAAYSNFICRPAAVSALTTEHQESITLNAEGEWTATHVPSWVSLTKTSGTGKTEFFLTIKEMAKGSGDRNDYVEFSLNGTEFTTRCDVSQRDYQYGEDECITLQQSKIGNGIDILFIGDSFDAEAIASGKYLDIVSRQMDSFFGVEPYTSYRDYFNVYACFPLSQENSINTANTWYNTRFSSYFASTSDCATPSLNCLDPDMVFDYAVANSPLTKEKMRQSLIIMALNNDEYGSTTILTEDGSAIAMCCNSSDPYPMDMRGMVQHEACGHAFGKLGEERVLENKYLSKIDIHLINEAHRSGWWRNLSLTGKLSEVEWSHFIFDPRYSNKVDVFEGGYGKTRGCFRAEINSCMNYGIPYFNAISRQLIVERILEYSGEGFSMEKFYEKDSDKWGTTNSSRAVGDFEEVSPIHNPVKIIKSKKY